MQCDLCRGRSNLSRHWDRIYTDIKCTVVDVQRTFEQVRKIGTAYRHSERHIDTVPVIGLAYIHIYNLIYFYVYLSIYLFIYLSKNLSIWYITCSHIHSNDGDGEGSPTESKDIKRLACYVLLFRRQRELFALAWAIIWTPPRCEGIDFIRVEMT